MIDDDEVDHCGHARQQVFLVVAHIDDDGVDYHALNSFRLKPNLSNRSFEDEVRICLNVESHPLALFD